MASSTQLSFVIAQELPQLRLHHRCCVPIDCPYTVAHLEGSDNGYMYTIDEAIIAQ